MKSLILIPSYLWKNTFKRWFENPISPLSKILVPILLSLLATLVLVFFNEAESQLRSKLKTGDSYDVYISERLIKKPNTHPAKQSLDEERMWLAKYGREQVSYIRQPFAAVKWKKNITVPIVVYTDSIAELTERHPTLHTPAVWLLTDTPETLEKRVEVEYSDTTLVSIPRKMPDLIRKNLDAPHILAVPMEMAAPLLRDGFEIHILAHFDNLKETRSFMNDTKAYYKAENRRIRVFSALEILENIEKINALQNYLRIGIVFSCGIILALILGTIAWLEYRQEAYLAALLRSFGTPRILLVWHAFLENLVLVLGGIGITFVIWKPIYSQLQQRITTMDLSPANSLTLSPTDSYTIFIAGIAGVLVAMLPLIFALRKPPGLILQ
ncbi:hypothetical protein Rhal01_01991 [Rubritalea halochordaticola]|uniref:ABC transporter permease n=1 Tax=Rubritalea halochordaticola TaxID=714537 RepID=A0ABP9V3B1_9BACT